MKNTLKDERIRLDDLEIGELWEEMIFFSELLSIRSVFSFGVATLDKALLISGILGFGILIEGIRAVFILRMQLFEHEKRF